MKKVGPTWLNKKLNIQGFQLTHESNIGTTHKTELSTTNSVVRTFKAKYDVNIDHPMSHLEFALKYDYFNLAFIKEIFTSVDHQIIVDYIRENLNRKYPRIIGYLYEFNGSKSIEIEITATNYESILNPSRYIIGDSTKITKWKVNDNLLGQNKFCTIIRRTAELSELLDWNIEEAIENLIHEYSPEIFKRASYYLYKKESKSSSKIEKEESSRDRIEKFIALLEEAGQKTFEESLSETELVRLRKKT